MGLLKKLKINIDNSGFVDRVLFPSRVARLLLTRAAIAASLLLVVLAIFVAPLIAVGLLIAGLSLLLISLIVWIDRATKCICRREREEKQ